MQGVQTYHIPSKNREKKAGANSFQQIWTRNRRDMMPFASESSCTDQRCQICAYISYKEKLVYVKIYVITVNYNLTYKSDEHIICSGYWLRWIHSRMGWRSRSLGTREWISEWSMGTRSGSGSLGWSSCSWWRWHV